MDDLFLYSENVYGKYAIPKSSSQRPAAKTILNGDVWELKTLKFILELNVDGDIVHAGTYFGDFLPALSKGYLNSKIYAFEGSKNSFEAAKETIKINNLNNVALNHMILGKKNEKVNFLISSDSQEDLGGVSSKVKYSNNNTIVVDQVSLDNFIVNKVGLIQLDVEGEELNVIKGAEQLIRRDKPVLILEKNNKLIKSEWFNQFMSELKYNFLKEIHGNLIYQV